MQIFTLIRFFLLFRHLSISVRCAQMPATVIVKHTLTLYPKQQKHTWIDCGICDSCAQLWMIHFYCSLHSVEFWLQSERYDISMVYSFSLSCEVAFFFFPRKYTNVYLLGIKQRIVWNSVDFIEIWNETTICVINFTSHLHLIEIENIIKMNEIRIKVAEYFPYFIVDRQRTSSGLIHKNIYWQTANTLLQIETAFSQPKKKRRERNRLHLINLRYKVEETNFDNTFPFNFIGLKSVERRKNKIHHKCKLR